MLVNPWGDIAFAHPNKFSHTHRRESLPPDEFVQIAVRKAEAFGGFMNCDQSILVGLRDVVPVALDSQCARS